MYSPRPTTIAIILAAVLAAGVLLVAGGFAWTWRPAIAPIADNERPRADEQTVRRGAFAG
jgi:hypothetical protein